MASGNDEHARSTSILRWWCLPFAGLLIAYGFLIGTPHPFERRELDVAVFVLAGVLMVAASLWPTRRLRLLAMGVSVFAVLSRGAGLLLFPRPPDLSATRIAAAVCASVMMAMLLAVVTLLSELNRPVPYPEGEDEWSPLRTR